MNRRRRTLVVLASMLPLLAAQPVQDRLRIGRQDLVVANNTLVVKLTIEVPDVDAAQVLRVHYRWRDKTSHRGSIGLLERSDGKRRAEILFVAQVAGGTTHHPPMLMLTVQQSSGAVRRNFEAHALDGNAKVSELLTIDAEAGEHDLGQKLKIGTLGGEPIYLSVGRAPAE